MLTLFCVDIRDIFEYIQIKVKKNYFYSIGVQLNNNVNYMLKWLTATHSACTELLTRLNQCVNKRYNIKLYMSLTKKTSKSEAVYATAIQTSI